MNKVKIHGKGIVEKTVLSFNLALLITGETGNIRFSVLMLKTNVIKCVKGRGCFFFFFTISLPN